MQIPTSIWNVIRVLQTPTSNLQKTVLVLEYMNAVSVGSSLPDCLNSFLGIHVESALVMTFGWKLLGNRGEDAIWLFQLQVLI